MAYSNKAIFEELRSGTIFGAAYAAFGSPYTNRVVVVTFKNNTDGDVVVSTDGVTDHKYFPAGSYEVVDVRTNAPNDTDLSLPIGLQFYVKDGVTPSTTGTFYIEAVSIEVLT